MLYMAPLFGLEGLKQAFDYADDVAILKNLKTLEENSMKLSVSISEALAWGISEGFTFDPSKSELILFSRKKETKE